jgi:hypothetical protein
MAAVSTRHCSQCGLLLTEQGAALPSVDGEKAQLMRGWRGSEMGGGGGRHVGFREKNRGGGRGKQSCGLLQRRGIFNYLPPFWHLLKTIFTFAPTYLLSPEKLGKIFAIFDDVSCQLSMPVWIREAKRPSCPQPKSS